MIFIRQLKYILYSPRDDSPWDPGYTLPFTIDLAIKTRGELSMGRTIYPEYTAVSDKVQGELPLGRTVTPGKVM